MPNDERHEWNLILVRAGLGMKSGLRLSRSLIGPRRCPECEKVISVHQKVCPGCKANLFENGRSVGLIYVGASHDLATTEEREHEKSFGRVKPKGKGSDA